MKLNLNPTARAALVAATVSGFVVLVVGMVLGGVGAADGLAQTLGLLWLLLTAALTYRYRRWGVSPQVGQQLITGGLVVGGLAFLVWGLGVPLIAVALFALVVWWLFFRDRSPQWNVYTSRWASNDDVRAFVEPKPLDGQGLLFVNSHAGVLSVRPNAGGRKERGHLLFCGPTRSGKSVALTENLEQWQGSAVVLDIKGELYRRTSGWRSRLGDVYVLSTEGRASYNGTQLDPIKLMSYSPEGLRSAAELILDSQQDRDPVFAQRASILLHAAFSGAQQQGKAGVVYLDALMALGHEGLIRYLHALKNPEVDKLLTQYLAFPPGEVTAERLSYDRFLGSAYPTLVTRLAAVTTAGVKTMLGKDGLDPKTLMQKPSTLYLTVPESELLALGPALKLTLTSLMSALIRAYDSGTRLPVPLMWGLDEAGRVPIPKLPDYLATIAGRNMSAMLFVQDLSQLRSAYGPDGASTVLANCRTQVFHPADDLDTARFVSQRTGRYDYSDVSTSKSRRVFSPATDTTKRSDRELLTPDEFMNQMHPDEVVCFTRGVMPIRGHRLVPDNIIVPPSAPPTLTALPTPRLRLVPPKVERAEPEPARAREQTKRNKNLDDLRRGL